MKKATNKATILIYTDGSGQRPDGKGSGIAWFREDTNEHHMEPISGLTNNEAEYRAVISALKALPKGSGVELRSDSLLVVSQLRGEYRVRDIKLEKLYNEVKTVAERSRLDLKVVWIPRAENRAGKLI
jgi:ribonuclease HI